MTIALTKVNFRDWCLSIFTSSFCFGRPVRDGQRIIWKVRPNIFCLIVLLTDLLKIRNHVWGAESHETADVLFYLQLGWRRAVGLGSSDLDYFGIFMRCSWRYILSNRVSQIVGEYPVTFSMLVFHPCCLFASLMGLTFLLVFRLWRHQMSLQVCDWM